MRIGALFAGYGGLEHGVQAVLGGDVTWYSEIDKGALKILGHRYPAVPNVGDITTVDWAQVEPVDVLTGGFPCQDVSHAGKRAGLRPDTRTGLWSQMAYAIDQLRPALVVAENVRGLLSAEAHSDLEPCPWCMGDGTGVSPLRALGAVLGDLADIGYDAAWYGLRAADVGAPHGRFRVFVTAYPHGGGRVGVGWLDPIRCDVEGRGGADGSRAATESAPLLPTPRTGDNRNSRTAITGANSERHGRTPRGSASGLGLEQAIEVAQGILPAEVDSWDDISPDLLPTPTTRDGKGRNQRDDDSCLTGALLPTPRTTDGTKGGPNQRGSSGDLMLPSAVQQLLPTPSAADGLGGHERRGGARGDELLLNGVAKALGEHLLPTPAVNDMGAAYTPDEWDTWTDEMKARHGNGNGHGKSLSIEAQRLLPTPNASLIGPHGERGPRTLESREGRQVELPDVVAAASQWGDYADAINRWEHTLGRLAPAPTMTSAKGNPQLSPAFVEWMMGLPAGWVTDTPGLTRNEALKALGNGVVPQQAEAALRFLLNALAVAA